MRLGNLIDNAGLTKAALMKALPFAAGALLFPIVYGQLQSRLLLKASPSMFAANSWGERAARILSGLVLGGLTASMGGQKDAGMGMTIMALAQVGGDIITGFINPASAAAQAVVKAEEAATGVGQMSAINPMGRGLAGLGYGSQQDQSMLFGVGTPDMSANRMFNGATVAIEEAGGFSGATVAIQPSNAFAGALS